MKNVGLGLKLFAAVLFCMTLALIKVTYIAITSYFALNCCLPYLESEKVALFVDNILHSPLFWLYEIRQGFRALVVGAFTPC